MFLDVGMRVAHHHCDGLSAAEALQRAEVAICLVVPGRPRLAAIVCVKVLKGGTSTCSIECGLNARSCRGIVNPFRPHIGQTIGPREYFALAVRQVGKRGNDALVEGNAAWLAVLCLSERDLHQCKINITPIEPERLANSRASVEQEYHQRAKMVSSRIYQSLGFLNGKRPRAPLVAASGA